MYLIFDFDGTIIETMNINYKKLKNELKEILNVNTITPMYEIINNHIEKKQICFNLIDKYEMNCLNQIKPKLDILDLYKKSPLKIILSRNGRQIIENFFKKNNLPLPDFICCRDNCINLKPNIEQINIIFKKFNYLNKNNICIVGDSWHDEQLSENIGCSYKLVK